LSVGEYARRARIAPALMTRHLADLGTTNRYHEVGFGLVEQFYDAMDKRVRLIRLQLAPALDLGLVPLFWEALEILRGQLSGGRAPS